MNFHMQGEFEYRGVIYGEPHQGIDIDMMKDWRVRSSDVLIATPAKSGTTWMGEILRHMREYHPDFQTNNKEDKYYVPYAELGSPVIARAVDCMDKMTTPRVMKTHLYYEFFQQKVEQEGLKVVVVLREPKDTLTSFYYHYCMKMIGFPGDFHQFFELVRQDKLGGGNVFKMSRDWWEKRHLPNVIVVKYEEMKKDCASVVLRISNFLQIPLDTEAIQSIVGKCSIGNMRKSNPLKEMKDTNGQPMVDAEKFFRKGVIGDWRNHMTQEEEDFVDDCVREYYDPVGLHFNV